MVTKVIKGGILIDGTGNTPVKDAVIIIEGKMITTKVKWLSQKVIMLTL
jgi:N-acyl-D-aspartate/D-glutamate deacylase